MAELSRLIRRALVTGTVASVTSTVALALAARAEGKGTLQPVNATSHWLNGDEAASRRGLDASDTLIGYATHHAATVFWALMFEAWIAARPPRSAARLLANATATSAIAAAVDYGPTPRRFTPGWEFVLSRSGMAVGYAAMAIGLAAVGQIRRPRRA